MQSHRNTLILLLSHVELSALGLSKIKDFTEFTFKVKLAFTVDFSNQDLRYFQDFKMLQLYLHEILVFIRSLKLFIKFLINLIR